MFELEHRVPIVDWERQSYRAIPIDASDPRHVEPLVRLDDYGVAYQSYHARSDGDNPPYHAPVEGSRVDTWLRKSAAERLVAVNAALRRFGHELFVLDGYRPIACQRGLWRFYYERAQRELDDPTPARCRKYALNFAADPTHFSPDHPRGWSAHTTGGAVDVTLRRLCDGSLVDMGSRYEEITEVSQQDHFERLLDAGEIASDDPRLWNRRLMHWAMHSHGWTNDPFVFWHYDWGNQLGVLVRRALYKDGPERAWYGFIDDPPRTTSQVPS
jgi:D-alanyl-D-alanine dipeptidase